MQTRRNMNRDGPNTPTSPSSPPQHVLLNWDDLRSGNNSPVITDFSQLMQRYEDPPETRILIDGSEMCHPSLRPMTMCEHDCTVRHPDGREERLRLPVQEIARCAANTAAMIPPHMLAHLIGGTRHWFRFFDTADLLRDALRGARPSYTVCNRAFGFPDTTMIAGRVQMTNPTTTVTHVLRNGAAAASLAAPGDTSMSLVVLTPQWPDDDGVASRTGGTIWLYIDGVTVASWSRACMTKKQLRRGIELQVPLLPLNHVSVEGADAWLLVEHEEDHEFPVDPLPGLVLSHCPFGIAPPEATVTQVIFCVPPELEPKQTFVHIRAPQWKGTRDPIPLTLFEDTPSGAWILPVGGPAAHFGMEAASLQAPGAIVVTGADGVDLTAATQLFVTIQKFTYLFKP